MNNSIDFDFSAELWPTSDKINLMTKLPGNHIYATIVRLKKFATHGKKKCSHVELKVHSILI